MNTDVRKMLASLSALLAVAACGRSSQPVSTPAPEEVAVTPPYHERIIVDNEDIRMWEYTYEPGGEGRHEHPHPRAVYIIEGGTLEFVADDGSARRLSPGTGMGGWSGPGNHRVRSVGEGRVKMIEIEVKQAGQAGNWRVSEYATVTGVHHLQFSSLLGSLLAYLEEREMAVGGVLIRHPDLFAAASASGWPVLLRIDLDGGHGFGATSCTRYPRKLL